MNFFLRVLQKNFTVKIRSLYDYQLRLMQGVVPPPSGVDIANTIKYFSQTLLTVLKDVPNSPLELVKNPEMDGARLGLFPSLDYKGLYNSLVPLIEVAPLIQYGIHAFGQAILQCLGSLLPFLEHDLIDNLPYLTASSIAVLPTNLHQDIVNTLCYYILPFTISRNKDREHDICQSVSSVMMMVFQYSTNPAHHCQLLECLMTHKQNVLKDVLCVIAYGTSTARSSAAKLLFYYWPAFNPNLFDRKGLICKLGGDAAPFVCQRDMCPNAGNAEAAKVCYDHCISITFATDSPPPLYLCIECANEIHREHPNQQFFDNLHPMQQVSMVCENKNCRSTDKYAISICFSTECASYNGNRPIRYCKQCHNNRHNNKRGGDHMVHKCLPPTWEMDLEMQTYMVESVVSLLKEAKVPSTEHKETTAVSIAATGTSGVGTPAAAGPGGSLSTNDSKTTAPPLNDNITVEDRQLLGRYGVWLMVGRCTPDENTPIDIMGRLIAMLFHWFHTTAYSHDGQEESTLEKLKIENVCGWLRNIINTHYKLFISCLLPHPPEYARVGGHWDALASRTSHLKDGLNRLFCLVPYEVITQDIWDYIMPHWMEAIVNDVPEKELIELKMILSKILDSDMSPLGFHAEKMYHFVVVRFEKTTSKVQEQALHWLQTLTMLEIIIPLQLLFTIFGEGVKNLKGEDEMGEKIVKPYKADGSKHGLISPVIENCGSSNNTSLSDDENRFSQQAEFETDAEHNLFCCILMLDILLKQMELQDIDKHTGLNSQLCKDVCWLLKGMLSSKLIDNHNCGSKSECGYCESSIMWHQLSLQLIKYLSPIYPAHPPDPPLEDLWEDSHSRKSPPDSEKKESKSDVPSMPIPDVHSVGGVLVHMPHIMTATVETVSEQLDLAAIIPAEKVVSAVARAITLSESDVGAATAQVAKPHVIGENDEPVESDTGDDIENFWHTSLGKFKFCVDELPQPLQYIYQILKEIPTVEKPDVLYYMLQCLNVLILHGDACTKASKEHRGFFIWCQENLLIKNLWGLCDSDHSHICQEAVPILLHCITLPAGSDVFWRVIQDDFHSSDWCVRFTSVERVTVIARFMDSSPLRNILQLQAALANAFCYLISSMDDTNVYVAQRATLYLGTIHDSAIKSLIMCLETQFDSVIVDRPMVLQCLYQLHNSLSERKILTWEFFLNRFDTLFLEAQINLEKSGDISYLRDLRNTDMNSDVFIRKLHRAQEALSQSDGSGASSVKTLSASFGTKWPYKRTMSAPASIVSRHDNKDGHMHSLNLVDDQNLLNFLQRVIDLEEADKETMHLLVFLLMQFLSRSDQAYPSDEKYIAKTQGIVLRHLYLLLGYSQNDKGLYLSPTRLRTSPAFSAFLSNLPQVMDQNHLMGRILLPTCLILLLYSPSPYHIPNNVEFQQPAYSLWAMEPHFRRNWLMSLVVLLYKYQYNQQPHCMQLTSLVRVVLNTLDAQHHHCRRIPATIIMGAPPSRSRDVSQPSLGTENEHPERLMTTPPLSPMYSSDGQSVQVSLSSKCGKAQVIYTKPSSTTSMETHWEEVIQCAQPEKRGFRRTELSVDGEDTESELIAIPESDMSDSTLHGSTQDLFEDGSEEITTVSSMQQKNQIISKTFKEGYISHVLKKSSSKRPTWFIGNEEEFLKSCEYRKGFFSDDSRKISPDTAKNCSKITMSSQVAILPVVAGRTSAGTIEKPSPLTIGKHKKIVEPSITPVCTPTSDCDDCFKNSQLLPAPSLERLLPIGASRSTEPPKEPVLTTTLESQLEIPCQERLLPIGQHNKDISQFVDKVKQALGLNMQIQKVEVPRTSDQPKKDDYHQSSSYSPRKLIKQVALESPPHQSDYDNIAFYKGLRMDNQSKDITINHRQRMRKAGPFTMGPFVIRDPRKPGAWLSPQLSPKLEGSEMKQSSFRIGDECVNERCSECGTVKEEYSDEELGLCIVALGTFIHREPALAAPMLPDILSIVSKVATHAMYPWQSENNIHLPGGAVSVAHQFLRCVLHQLAPNGIFTQMFQTHASENIRVQFFKSVIQALLDFTELNPIAPLQLLLETLNSKKTLTCDILPTVLENIACYLECLPTETTSGPTSATWGTVLQQLEILYRRIVFMLNVIEEMTILLKIVISIFKVPIVSQHKGLLEPLSKIISCAVQTQVLHYNYIVELCYLCNRSFARERDKLMLNRLVVYELVQAMKFKTSIPDSNLLMLINIVLQDVGGSIPQNIIVIKDCPAFTADYSPGYTNISDCMRLHLNDILEFLTDFHTLAKIKSYCKGVSVGLNEDTIGGIIKCAMSQYLALEITRSNGRDNRAVTRYFPWLYNTSSNQQSPKEFVECISHVRLLSWLLLGSLTHTAMVGTGPTQTPSQPIPHEASCQIADHIQIIMAGFSEQPKASVLHMSSLFHTFILCQLWTIYLEQSLGNHNPLTEAYNVIMNVLFDFWGKVTPCILQLIQQSKILSEIVSLHFLSMLEALLECHCTFVGKLLPLWTPVLCSNQVQTSGQFQMRLQFCRNSPPAITGIEPLSSSTTFDKKRNVCNPTLLKWLQRLQFKMGQIELQSSTATQFYSL